MPNVLLTTTCNLTCEYCFAKEKLQDKKNQIMSLANVRKVISFLKRSNDPNFRMMGGEPTLHPEFYEIVMLALNEGMHLDLLSNGTWPRKYNDLFAQISPSNLLFLLNIDHPDRYSSSMWQKIENNLSAIAGRKGVSLSFNLFSKTPRYQYILDLTAKYAIRRVRISFALPVLGADNARLPLEDYEDLADFVVEFVRKCNAQDVEAQLDNAIPLCIFSYEQAGELLMKGVLDLNRNARCKPIVDIGPDLTVWSCFCLSKIDNRRLEEFENVKEIQTHYENSLGIYQDEIFPMEKCYNCDYRSQWGCQGGCTTFSIEKAGDYSPNGRIKQKAHTLLNENTVLKLAPHVSIKKYAVPAETYRLQNKVTRTEIEVGSGLKPLFPLLDGKHTVEKMMDVLLSTQQPNNTNDPLDAFATRILKESYIKVLTGLLRQDFLHLVTADTI